MDLELPELATFDGFLLQNGEWDIVMAEPSKVATEWKDVGQSYSSIVYQFGLARKKPYYVTAILVPVLLLSVLIVAVFWVPIESGEKMGYCLTILLTYTLFLSIVSEELPPIATDISYLQVYLAVSMAIGVVVTLLTLFVQNLYHRGDAEPSDWLKSLTNNFLLPITCRKRCCACCCAGKGKEVEEGGRYLGNGTAGISMVAHTNMDHGFLRHVGEEKMTYQDVARAFDRFFLLTFSLVMLLVTAVFTAFLFLHVNEAPPALTSYSV